MKYGEPEGVWCVGRGVMSAERRAMGGRSASGSALRCKYKRASKGAFDRSKEAERVPLVSLDENCQAQRRLADPLKVSATSGSDEKGDQVGMEIRPFPNR